MLSDLKNTTATDKINMPVLGMSCAACAVSVESILQNTPGVKQASVNFAAQTVQVEYNQQTVTPVELQKAVQSVGYDLILDTDNASDQQAQAQQGHI